LPIVARVFTLHDRAVAAVEAEGALGTVSSPMASEEEAMKLTLHHINLCSTNVPAMDEFYRSVLDMAPEPSMEAFRDTSQGFAGDVAFVTDGTTQMHLAEKDLGLGFRTNQPVNPLERGHIAFRTDDIDAFKRRLEEKGIAYANFGARAMKGWEQIFFYDPEGNIIEVHQVHA
jgi:catechol 2,3-dioxygenase-like lactoylglutathione lyase family enzyme